MSASTGSIKQLTAYALLFLLFVASPANAAITFTYDAGNRLTSVTYDDGQTITYSYDAGGNLMNASNSDNTPLTVVSTDPANGATNVPVDKAVYAVFSNAIKAGSNIANITIKNGASAVAYTYGIDHTKLLLLPTGDLAPSVTYSVYIPSGAVQDYYGNTLASTYSFSFTTEIAANVPVTGISLNKTSDNIAVGNTGQLTAIITPTNATNQNVTWTSSNPGVATVDQNGTVTAVAEGTATITATTVDGGKIATCILTVIQSLPGSGGGGVESFPLLSAPLSYFGAYSSQLAMSRRVIFETNKNW